MKIVKPITTTRFDRSLWLWWGAWVLSLMLILGVTGIYLFLPLDGAAGDTASFTADGFHVKWLLEERPGELQVGDVITHLDGHTIEESLRGASSGLEWGNGEIVTYEVLRGGQPLELQIQLAPVPFRAVLDHWGPQMLVVLCFFIIGSFIFWRRPHEPAARWQMLFHVILALAYWIDGYNFQPGTLFRGWPFWFHYVLEHLSFSLSYAALLMFALVFPKKNVLIKRFPRFGTWMVMLGGLIFVLTVMLPSTTVITAIKMGRRVSFLPVMLQLIIAVGVVIHSGITSRDPVARAQIKWILVGSSVPFVVAVVGYSLPEALGGRPLVTPEVSMFASLLVPISFAIAVLRYRIFDIELVINRGLVYGTLTLLLSGLYLIIVRGLTLAVQALVSTSNETLIVFIATLTIALVFAPLRARVQVLIDRVFFRSKVNYQRLLPELSAQLAANIVLEQLTPLLTKVIPHRLQIANATLLVLDSAGEELVSPSGDRLEHQSSRDFSLSLDHPLAEHLRRLNRPLIRSQGDHLPEQATMLLEEHEIELSIPLIIGQASVPTEVISEPLVGLYNLGSKISGNPYTRDEVQLLTALGSQAAVSVENARLYREIESYSRMLEQQVEARTKELTEKTDYLDNILGSATEDAIITTDLDFRITYFNPVAEKFYGIPADDAIGHLISSIRSVTPSDEAFGQMFANLNGEGEHRYETVIEIDGQSRKISSRLSGIYNQDGDWIGYARFSRDITERQRAEDALRNIAVLEERQRVARDLHDSVIQSIHSMSMSAKTARYMFEKERYQALPATLDILIEGSQQTHKELRLLLHGLQVTQDAETDLIAVLQTRMENVEKRAGIKTSFQVEGRETLPKAQEIGIYYLAQEALNNALKHAEADCIEVQIQKRLSYLSLVVTDNGRGFPIPQSGLIDVDKITTIGMGMHNMIARAKDLGGMLTLDSVPGTGTTLRFEMEN
jgi:PAS domain S-box-containing protein